MLSLGFIDMTKDLLKQYKLEATTEPKREDFEEEAESRERDRGKMASVID